MVKRLVKVPFVNMRVMFPRDENRKDVTFKMRRGASLRAELLRNRVEMPTCCEDMNCLCNCAVRVRVEITGPLLESSGEKPSSRRRVDGGSSNFAPLRTCTAQLHRQFMSSQHVGISTRFRNNSARSEAPLLILNVTSFRPSSRGNMTRMLTKGTFTSRFTIKPAGAGAGGSAIRASTVAS